MKRIFGVAVVGLILVSLTACSNQSGTVSGSKITIGFEDPISSINTDLQDSVSTMSASADLANLTTASFYSIDTAGNLSANVDFGSVEVTSQKPFTVKYLLTGKATWSDGTKVSATDLLLSWAAASGFGGYDFKSSRDENGFRYVTEQPAIGDDGLSLTVTFNQATADYKTALTVPVAAHALAKITFASEKLGAKEASAKTLEAITAPKRGDLSALAKAYRNAFRLTKSTLKNPDLFVSAGPYVVTEASSNGLTLKVNPDNVWMPKGRCETLNVVFYDDALSAVSALKAGAIDFARLEPTSTNSYSSLISAIKASKNLSSSVVASNQVETVLFNQTSQSSFSSAAFGEPGSESADNAALEARRAFLGIISVSKIRTLISANQTIQDANSLVFSPESPYYQASTQDSSITGYQFADAQKSYNALQKLGLRVPVRVLFDTANPRAQTEYSVFADLASQVGFSLSNVSTANISDALKVGDYDVYLAPQRLLADQGVSLQKGFYFSKGFPSNSNLIKLMTDYGRATTAVAQAAVLKKLDSELISQAYALPLYQLPTIFASSKKFAKTPVSADGLSLTAGYADWNLSSK
ncbi:MAG: hypothetical protein RLZ28_720 [Actinomycetota bacterium]